MISFGTCIIDLAWFSYELCILWFGYRPLCRLPDLFAMAGEEMNAAELQQNLTQIPIPAATRHQSILYLAQLGKIFSCLLEETLKNQPDERPIAVYGDLSEAFHKSLFDLKILTMALLEGQYIPAARVIVMTTNANSPRGNDWLPSMNCILMFKRTPATTLHSGCSMNMDHIFELKALN